MVDRLSKHQKVGAQLGNRQDMPVQVQMNVDQG